MPTDPFVAPELEDRPRQEPNLAPGVQLPAAHGWRADRPGDLVAGQPMGDLLGRPGPNVGYAVMLAGRLRDSVAVGPHEHTADALAVIADTDVTRSREEWVVGIQNTLRWLGLDWDEGPYLQSERFALYLDAADRLLAQGDAYECFCTEDEVKARNDAAVAAGRPPGYDG